MALREQALDMVISTEITAEYAEDLRIAQAIAAGDRTLFKAVYDRIRQEGYPVTDFPELCAIKGRAGELWDMGVPCAAATSPDSLMRRDDGDLSVPYLYCVPGYCNLSTRWVGFRWRREFAWFLVGAK